MCAAQLHRLHPACHSGDPTAARRSAQLPCTPSGYQAHRSPPALSLQAPAVSGRVKGPDTRLRIQAVVFREVGTPRTHRRFLGREDGSYGPIPSRRPAGMLGMPMNRTGIQVRALRACTPAGRLSIPCEVRRHPGACTPVLTWQPQPWQADAGTLQLTLPACKPVASHACDCVPAICVLPVACQMQTWASHVCLAPIVSCVLRRACTAWVTAPFPGRA